MPRTDRAALPTAPARFCAALAVALTLFSASAMAEAPPPLARPTWALHGGASVSPGSSSADFVMLSYNQPVRDLPHGIDLLRFNLGAVGVHHNDVDFGRVEFGSIQIGSDRGRYTLAGGLAAVSRTTPALSSALQFHTQLTVRLGRAELGLGHLSNAGLKKPNRGETFFTLGWLF
jgi:hypothetical protein